MDNKRLWRSLHGLHTVEWVVSLYEWAKNNLANLVKWVGSFVVSGLAMMSWADVVPWAATVLLIFGWVILLFYRPKRPTGGATLTVSATVVPETASYEEVYEIMESQLKGNGIDLIANMLSEYRQECPDDGMFKNKYVIRRFRHWLSEKITNLLPG